MAGKSIYPPIAPGDTFGKLTAIKRVPDTVNRDGFRRLTWLCRCECGEEKSVVATYLHNGNTRSCGGHRVGNLKHGWSTADKRKIYHIWKQMIARCTNPDDKNYKRYGGNGIRVCKEWVLDFDRFFADMGPRPTSRHSVERKNGKGHYEPENCHWATYREQNQNTSRNVYMEYQGERLCLTEIARRTGINENTLRARLQRGMSLETALSRPLGRWIEGVPRPKSGPDGRFV